MEKDRNYKKESKEKLGIKNTVTEIKKKIFDGYINRQDMAEETITKLEAMSIQTSKTGMQREKRRKTYSHTHRPEYSRTVGQFKKF